MAVGIQGNEMEVPMDAWPSAGDYAMAVQALSTTARHAALRGARPRLGALGLPKSASGQRAIVFPLDTPDGVVALRCPTAPSRHAVERHLALEQHRTRDPLPAFATCRLLDDAIVVRQRARPAAVLEWIDGDTLDCAVQARVDNPSSLRVLADKWREVTAGTAAACVAHGDYQHGNVLVDVNGSLRVVDFDAVWLPTLEHLPPGESGHPAYQHPARAGTGAWGRWVDAFSVLLIDVSLRAVAADRDLWSEFHSGDNLIFGPDDLQSPGDGGLWPRLFESSDRDVAVLAGRLASWCSDAVDAHSVEEALAPARASSWTTAPMTSPAGFLDRPTEVISSADGPATSSTTGAEPTATVPRARRYVSVVASILLLVAAGVAGASIQDRDAASVSGSELTPQTSSASNVVAPSTTTPAPSSAPSTSTGAAAPSVPPPPTRAAPVPSPSIGEPAPSPRASTVVVPALLGKSYAQAKSMLEALDLVPEPWPFNRSDVPRYTVIDQPAKFAAGTRVAPGTSVQFGVADPPYCAAHPTKETCTR
jgi:hypothetical protein